MRNSDFRMQNAELPVQTWNLDPGTWNCRRRRLGVSILEVLFAIMVTTVGLLGAIAIFPVASAQARRAKINDQTASSGHTAVHLFDAAGMRRPFDRWYTWSATVGEASASLNPPRFIPFLGVFPNDPVLQTSRRLNTQQCYCLDTRFIVRNISNWDLWVNNTRVVAASSFPYFSWNNAPTVTMNRVAFFPGTLNPTYSPPATALRDQFDRLNTTTNDASGAPSYGRNLRLADAIFQLEDDHTFLRPGLDDVSQLTYPGTATNMQNDRTLPAFQHPFTIKRPTLGHHSWLATLVPQVDVYSNAPSDAFNMSVVVFYDRPTDMYLGTSAAPNDQLMERTVRGDFQSTGETGGEIMLSWAPSNGISTANTLLAEERLKLRSGDWVLVGGVQRFVNPVTGNTTNLNRFQWYRVAHCDPEIDAGSNVANTYTRYATLMGQDWNMGVGIFQNATATSPSYVEVTLMEGVVGVYEKSIRLDYGSTF